MSYSILAISVFVFVAVYTLLLAKIFINLGIKINSKGEVHEIKVLPKIPKKPKSSAEDQRYADIMWNIENFTGRGSKQREVK